MLTDTIGDLAGRHNIRAGEALVARSVVNSEKLTCL